MNKTTTTHPATAVEENALSTRREFGHELSVAHEAALAQHEVQSAITVALKFPRKEADAYGSLMKSCTRPTFAEKALYRFPRGGTNVEGPSVNLAREGARVFGNLRYGFEIVADSQDMIHLRGYAWDMQSNTKVTQDASFKKLIYRKAHGWVTPDERDLRELVNKHGSVAVRNCILQILPRDMIEDAMRKIKETIKAGVAADPEAHRKAIVTAFAEINTQASDLEKYLGNPIHEATPDQITELRTIYASIKDGQSRWSDYIQPETHQDDAGDTKSSRVSQVLKDKKTQQNASQSPE